MNVLGGNNVATGACPSGVGCFQNNLGPVSTLPEGGGTSPGGPRALNSNDSCPAGGGGGGMGGPGGGGPGGGGPGGGGTGSLGILTTQSQNPYLNLVPTGH